MMKFKQKKTGLNRLRRNDMIFYCTLVAIPLLHFILFYVVVNINSILLAFQSIDKLTNQKTWTLETMKRAFTNLTQQPMMKMRFRNSVRMFFIVQIISEVFSLVFSFYIYKKYPGWSTFRVILYIFRYFVDRAIPMIAAEWFGKQIEGFLSGPDFRFETLMFYNIFFSFGSTVLLYSNRMSGLSVDVLEAGQLDGVSGVKEFWYITFPHLYPLFSTFAITSLVGIFTGEYNLFTFGTAVATPELQTIGYWLFVQTYEASLSSDAMFPILAGTGMIITIVVAPATLLTRHLMEKYGPSED